MLLHEFVYRESEALTEAECDWILEWFQSKGADMYLDTRDKRVCADIEIPEDDPLFPLLDSSFYRISCDYIDKFPEVLNIYEDGCFFNDGFLVTKYDSGKGFFQVHVDSQFGFANPRQFATIWYLNDVEEGGETGFPLMGTTEKPKKGSAIHFPCNWMFPHSGKTPLSADKYIVTTFTYAYPYSKNDANLY